jgi:Domain of unknown function (DUF6946)/HD domain
VKVGFANEKYIEAAAFAVERHGAVKQERRGTVFPYVVHPLRVGEILERFRFDSKRREKYSEDVVIAGLLHDTVEDAGATYAEIADRFGATVAALVRKASEEDKSLDWKPRKEASIEALRREADIDALLVVAADKLDNVLSLVETLRARGPANTWRIFNAGQSCQHWYYRTIAEVLLEKDPRNLLFRTLDAEVHRVFPDKGRETRFHSGKPLATPQDARAYLADPIRHWRPKYSAFELAHAWIKSSHTPEPVDDLLKQALGEYELLEGFFEKETPLGTAGRPSQTDLLLVLRSKDGLAVAAIEGKAREPFGDYVKDWNDGTPSKRTRLDDLRTRLGIPASGIEKLRYQLLHRTVAALLEAERYGAETALMIVHAFGDPTDSFRDFSAFTAALGVDTTEKNILSPPKVLGGVTLRLGWASDQPQ